MAEPRTINDPNDSSAARVINGALQVSGNFTASSPSDGATGSPVPGNASFIGFGNATNILTGVSSANPLPVSANVTATNPSVAPTGAAVPGNATFVGFKDGSGNLNPANLGNNTAANSVSVVVATNQAAVPVNANVTGGNVVVTGNVVLPANITANVTAVPANMTVQVTNTPAVTVSGNVGLAAGTNIIGALSANQTVNLDMIGGSAYALGNATAANSAPVVIATNQGAVPVTLPANVSVNVDQIGGSAYALGNNTAANSAPVVIATNQGSVPVTPAANSTVNLTQVSGTTVNAGNSTAANSLSVVIATNQGSVPVTPAGNSSVNVQQFGGTTVVTGTGAGGAGIPRFTMSNDSALAANQTVNLNMVAGVATVTGGVNGSQGVGGLAASGVAVAGNPLLNGGRAQNAEQTAVTNGQAVAIALDLTGKQITSPYANKENWIRGNITLGNTTPANITGMGAQGGSTKIYITSIQAFRTDSGTTLVYFTLNDTGNTTVPLPPNGGAAVTYPVPLVIAANTAANVTLSANITSLLVSAQGFTGT